MTLFASILSLFDIHLNIQNWSNLSEFSLVRTFKLDLNWFCFLYSCSTGDRVPLHCVDKHPNQQHIVATGGQDGMLCIWDVRQGNTPFSLIEAHSAESEYPLNSVDF